VRLIDSHTHLDDAQFNEDRAAVIERARAAGVERMLGIGTGGGPPDLEAGVRLAGEYSFMLATIGVHPHDAAKATDETFERLRELAAHPKVVALGEIGLDYFHDFSPRDVQRAVFARQLGLAAEARLPIIIHSRDAWEDTRDILRQEWRGEGILHCFTGDATMARQALDAGFCLAFGGVLTFPKAEPVREAARLTPADRLLIETDCPYLAPVPHRGKRNEPAFVLDTARRLGEVRGQAMEEIAALTADNFERLCLRGGTPNG